MMTEDNPYQAPTIAATESIAAPSVSEKRTSYALWPALFAANMVVPLVLGAAIVGSTGLVGLAVAALTLFLPTWYVHVRHQYVGRALTVGGTLVALTQVMPFFHFFAGIVGVSCAELVAPPLNDSGPFEFGHLQAFVATFVTGAILLSGAAALGLIVTFFWRSRT